MHDEHSTNDDGLIEELQSLADRNREVEWNRVTPDFQAAADAIIEALDNVDNGGISEPIVLSDFGIEIEDEPPTYSEEYFNKPSEDMHNLVEPKEEAEGTPIHFPEPPQIMNTDDLHKKIVEVFAVPLLYRDKFKPFVLRAAWQSFWYEVTEHYLAHPELYLTPLPDVIEGIPGMIYKSSNFIRASLHDREFLTIALQYANFCYAKIAAGRFEESQVMNSTFYQTYMGHSYILESDFYEVLFMNTGVGGSRFENTKIRDCTFIGVDFANVDFRNVWMHSTWFYDIEVDANTEFHNVRFDNCRGVAAVYVPNMSSRGDYVYGFLHPDGVKIKMGCWYDFAQVSRDRVFQAKNGLSEELYIAAINLIEKALEADRDYINGALSLRSFRLTQNLKHIQAANSEYEGVENLWQLKG